MFDIDDVMTRLAEAMQAYETPLVEQMSDGGETPFRILIATLLSLRTRDTQTAQVVPQLFALADTPATMVALPLDVLTSIIYPVGFYRTKATTIQRVCRVLLDEHGGIVPNDLDTLLTLPGVGRKTANLVLTRGFGLPGICVDTHVHRICNRWGYVQTKSPDETEQVLRAQLPPRYWIPINGLLVTLGQNICHPRSPRCSICAVATDCARIGVDRSR